MKMPQLDWLGKAGIVGLGLLLFCLSYYVGNIAPAQSELDNLKREAAQLAASGPAGGDAGGAGPSAGTAASRRTFTTATESIKELSSIAERHGVTIDRATYSLSDKDGQRRLEINLPMKTSYLSLRAYLREVLALPAAPSLDELNLQRQQPSETLVEANLRLSYYFAGSP